MSSKEPLLALDKEKWHQMLLIVNQHTNLLYPDLTWQFKKLFLLRLLTENIFIFILQYIGLNLTTLSLTPSPLWFATGTSCAYLFLRGYSILPGIWLGTFSAYCMAKAYFWVAFACATVFSLQATLLLWLCYQYLNPTLLFYRLKIFAAFIGLTAIVTGISSFLLLCFCYASLSHVEPLLQLLLQWWLANFNAILIFSCALITLDAYFSDFYAFKQLKSSAILFGLLFCIIITFIFSHTPVATTCMGLLVTLITVIISTNLGWCGAISAVFLTGMLLCFAGFMDGPVYFTYCTSMTLLLLQLFLCLNSIIGLGIGIKNQS